MGYGFQDHVNLKEINSKLKKNRIRKGFQIYIFKFDNSPDK